MDKLYAGRNYLKYLLGAKNAHDIHSPFVFDLYNNVIRHETPYYGYDLIESVRAHCLLDESEISIVDFGTGNDRREKISSIARKALKPKKYAQLLFRLANRFQPNNTLEIGTSLGITTLYLSFPKKNNHIITLEGSPEIASIATRNFKKLARTNIELICGEFSSTLPVALKKLPVIDLLFLDGNHRRDATVDYFRLCLQHSNEQSVFIIDDIHWSPEMNAAWEDIKADPAVTLTIDLFQLGIIFLRKGFIKQHFMLKF